MTSIDTMTALNPA